MAEKSQIFAVSLAKRYREIAEPDGIDGRHQIRMFFKLFFRSFAVHSNLRLESQKTAVKLDAVHEVIVVNPLHLYVHKLSVGSAGMDIETTNRVAIRVIQLYSPQKLFHIRDFAFIFKAQERVQEMNERRFLAENFLENGV